MVHSFLSDLEKAHPLIYSLARALSTTKTVRWIRFQGRFVGLTF